MTADAVAHALPSDFNAVLRVRSVSALALGDACLAAPLALDAIALLAVEREISRILFWGRRAAFHRDRFAEIDGLHRDAARADGADALAKTRCATRASERFDPIDFIEHAEWIADAARNGTAIVVLSPDEPLEARLLSEFNAHAAVTPLLKPRL